MKQIEIHQVTDLPTQMPALEKEAVAEGFKFITRLIAEWHSGVNRFDAPGECLMAAYFNQQLIGIGGLSVDPYGEADTARLRRFYVVGSSRRQYVGQRLVSALVAHAALGFQSVRLSSDTGEGDAFYLRCGFRRTQDLHATHIMLLPKSETA